MPLFSINKKDTEVFELRIDGSLKRTISLREYQSLKDHITLYLETNGMADSTNVLINPNSFALILDEDIDKEFEHLFLIGPNKFLLPLPKELSFSGGSVPRPSSDSSAPVAGERPREETKVDADEEPIDDFDKSQEPKPLIYTYSTLKPFERYWQDPTQCEKIQRKLFAQLASDIIEVPYADDPREYIYRFGQVAFHPNHGSAHAVRLVILFNKYLQIIQEAPPATVPEHITQEERACLALAMFLFRSGRTNELGWSGDPSYSKRSAAIFTHIAYELGHSKELVDAIAKCFDYKANVLVGRGFWGKSLSDSVKSIFLYQRLFQLAHTSDLVRCQERYATLKESLTNTLTEVFGGRPYNSSLVDSYLQFAAQCCVLTGSPVTVRDLQEIAGGTYGGNPYKMVHTANNIVESLETLSNMALSSPPTSPARELSFFSRDADQPTAPELPRTPTKRF